jgi:chromosome segregation protein
VRFTRLKLNGFKSFVDPTDLVIADGLTGVVGPNGCGKSNLLEALRWVMGENRPTAMRGDGMEDVIFAGAASRPARHFAEVALTLDNSERLAPSGFNDSDTLDISRRITRDAGSAYRVNGREVRARDVQMMFADAATGAHSPALVRQGQIAELINAKPKSRRKVLEDAAGIGGLYQRRHEAELRLNATEANLARVDDVLEALATQLASLARQVRQAARYREIGVELRRAEGVLLYGRWRAASAAHHAAAADLRRSLAEAARAETAARAAIAARETAEAALPPLREEEAIAGAIVQRLAIERGSLDEDASRAEAAIAALAAQLEQLDRDMEREAALNHDAGETLERLTWEEAEIIRANDGHDDRLASATQTTREAAASLADLEDKLSAESEAAARLSGRHHAVERQLTDARTTLDKNRSEAARAEGAATEAHAAVERATQDVAAAQAAETRAQQAAEAAEAALTDSETTRADAQTREAEARAARSGAEGEAKALQAEAAALARLVEREASAGDQVLDRLTVAPGYEQALGAALSDDLQAGEVAEGRASGWALLPPYDAPPALPAGVEPLGEHVTAPPVLARRLAQIGLVSPEDGARLQDALRPGQRLVSRAGDLWRWDGFRTAARDAPSAAALRLQQLNRLVALKGDLSEAEARARGMAQAHEHLQTRLAEATRAEAKARDARRAADADLTAAHRTLARAEADRSLAQGRLESATLAATRHRDAARDAAQALAEAELALADLDDLEESRASVEAARARVEAARSAMLSARAAQEDLRRTGEARARRLQDITKEMATWRTRLANAETRSRELATRHDETAAALETARARPGELQARRAALREKSETAEARRRKAADALATGEANLRDASEAERATERAASQAREARARAEAMQEAAEAALKEAEQRILDEAETTPERLLEHIGDPAALPAPEAAEAEVARLRRAREALGAVNLRADEDAREVQEEYDTLGREKADLEEAVRKLRAGINGLNREGRERLLTAFEQVNVNFARHFTHLFGGGEARLVLVESDDPLEAGLEILCQPPGKKLSTLSLLSGGEQTLTALALIFGVFLANPAPICVLDEVDAPLDDANVARFCDLLDEMTRQTDTRFLIITHHAVTMARMDRLFGVTMGEQGVSQLVSVDLKRAEALVA